MQTVVKENISYQARVDIIKAAYAEYNTNRDTLSRLCSAKTFLNGELHQRGMRLLAADEFDLDAAEMRQPDQAFVQDKAPTGPRSSTSTSRDAKGNITSVVTVAHRKGQ